MGRKVPQNALRRVELWGDGWTKWVEEDRMEDNGMGYEKRVTEDESVTLLGCEQWLLACSLRGRSALLSRIALCSPPKDEDLQTKRRYRQSVPHNVPPPKDEDLQGKRRYRQSVPRNVAFRKMRICRQRGGTVKSRLAMFLLVV